MKTTGLAVLIIVRQIARPIRRNQEDDNAIIHGYT
jgi:hypothetical protein